MKTRILPCNCNNSYMDTKYGKGRRVHNRIGKGQKDTDPLRCVVCLTTRTEEKGRG